MSDIVEELRTTSPDDYDDCAAVMEKAADEIKRLRAALEPFALVVPFDFAADDEPVLMRIKASAFRRARAELEAKDA